MPLSFLFSGGFPWRLVGCICAIALLVAVKLQYEHIQEMSRALDTARQAAEDQARLLERLQHEATHANQIVANVVLKSEATRKQFSALRQEIYGNARDEDGVLAGVLRRTLDRLPDSAAAAGSGSQ